MSWIKVQNTLPESPKVFRLAHMLKVGRMEALGYAVRWFCWLDCHCAEGSTELTARDVDALLGMSGITRAFCELGWAFLDEYGYVFVVDFDKHNGENAKKRAETQSRVAAHRERQKEIGTCNAKNVTLALPDKNIYSNNNVVGSSTVVSADTDEPAPTPGVNDEGFRTWLSAMCAAHPSASKSLYLAPDVLKAAKEAYARCPQAAEHAAMLQAYYADPRLAAQKYYAPRGQRRFFEDLEDVLSHAERWRRWAGWKKVKKKCPTSDEAGSPPALDDGLTMEERIAILRGED
ncbi:MAG: hypothetical protein IJA63_06015 [Akkermansia sp.]|nr:hypothetical protein [Akkermansia sp.]